MMAKTKADKKPKEPTLTQNFYSGTEEYDPSGEPETKAKEKTVVGLIEAEKYQKSGWILISATRPSDDPFGDKEYKFRKDN
jgi:hypothetical protein